MSLWRSILSRTVRGNLSINKNPFILAATLICEERTSLISDLSGLIEPAIAQ
jgi:hypothetical protein